MTSSFDLSRVCNFCTMGRGVDWAVQDVAQLRQWLVDGRKLREISTQSPLNRRAPLGSFTDAWRACEPKAAISSIACDGPAHAHAFFFFLSGLVRPVLKHGPKSLTVEHFFFGCWNLQAPRKRLLGPRHKQPFVILKVVRARA